MAAATTGQIAGVLPAGHVPSSVRTARMDRPLLEHSFDPTYADAKLERIVRDAADDARTSARSQGYAQGWAEGQRAAAEHARSEREARVREDVVRRQSEGVALTSALAALDEAAAEVHRAESQAWESIADGLTDAAVRIVEALLARELAATDAGVLEAARTALRSLGGGATAVRMNPTDLASVGATGQDAVLDHVTLTADASVSPGSARARFDDAQVLVDLPGTLARIEAVMRG